MAAPKRPRWGFILLGVVLVVLVIWAVLAAHKPAKPKGPPPVPVTIAKVTLQDVPT